MHIVDATWKITSLPVFEGFRMQSIFDDMNNGARRAGFDMLSYADWVHALYKADRLIDLGLLLVFGLITSVWY